MPWCHESPASKSLPRSLSRDIGHKCSRARAFCKSAKTFPRGFRQFPIIDPRRIRLFLPPLPRRHRLRISPQAFLGFSCVLLQPFQNRIIWRILSITPAPAVFDQRVSDVGPIGQKHISNGASVAILPVAAVLWGHGISRFRRQENPHPICHTGGVKWSRAHFHEFVACS